MKLSEILEETPVFSAINPAEIKKAYQRLSPYINKTPILESPLLNKWLGHEFYFKAEMFQKTGAFKARGALNCLLKLKEMNQLPKRIIAYSSGNHAQGVSWAGKMMGIETAIYLPKFTSPVKIQATKAYGAEVIITETRMQAESLCAEEVEKGAYLIPPFDNDYVIEGQGTLFYEAFEQGVRPDAVFVPCGGGGLTSGTYLATELLSPATKVFAVEPEIANDAKISLDTGKIFKFPDTPMSIADGTRTLAVSERTFHYLKKSGGVFLMSEEEIIYWSQWVNHLLKVTCEPSCAMTLGAAVKWLKTQKEKKKVLCILSGGNMSADTYSKIWAKSRLEEIPTL